MDWQLAIEKNREGLAAVVAGLVPLAEMAQSLTLRRPLPVPSRLAPLAPQDEGNGPRRANPLLICRFIARILRPAEAALRRLIVVVAALAKPASRSMPRETCCEGKDPLSRPFGPPSPRWGEEEEPAPHALLAPPGRGAEPAGLAVGKPGDGLGEAERGLPTLAMHPKNLAKPLPDFSSFSRGSRLPSFRLTDPPRRVSMESIRRVRTMPRISVPGILDRTPEPEPVANVATILRRIETLNHALRTLPRQARRLNRLMARRAGDASVQATTSPLRRGLPPGHRKRPRHEVDAILHECHWLARDCGLKPP